MKEMGPEPQGNITYDGGMIWRGTEKKYRSA